jgi:hypothetical protein
MIIFKKYTNHVVVSNMEAVKIELIFKDKTNEMLKLQHSFVWCWRRMEKISSTNHVKNEEVLHTSQGQRNSLTKRK